MSKSDTPRTDDNEQGWAYNFQYDHFSSLMDNPLPWAEFSRKLERELTAARAEMHKSIEERREESMKATAARSGLEMWKRCSQKAEQELVTVTKQRDRLAEALKMLMPQKPRHCHGYDQFVWDNADEALAAVEGGKP